MSTAKEQSDGFLEVHLPGASPAMRQLRSDIIRLNRWHRLAAGRVHCTLITGETGTGKGRLAKLIVQHNEWDAQGGDDVPTAAALASAAANLAPVLLTAVPDQLAESELFGHVAGSFTDAKKDRKGVFGDDNIQNVLLDEIGDCSLALQGKLLQVIEDGSFRRLGDAPSNVLKAHARVVLATRHDPAALVAAGRLREDLFWRIIPFRLRLPSLRERTDEIQWLINKMVNEHTSGLHLRALQLPDDPMTLIRPGDVEFAERYQWPGNLRQLSDVLLSFLITAGELKLEEVVARTMHSDAPAVEKLTLRAEIESRLRGVLDGKRPPYGKIGALWKQLRAEVGAALYDVYRAGTVTAEDFCRIFADQDIKDIRSQLSRYRARRSKGQ